VTAEDAATKDQKVSLLAWTIAGSAMLVPAFVFQCLATRKPDLDVESARTRRPDFGDYVGFNQGGTDRGVHRHRCADGPRIVVDRRYRDLMTERLDR
jgi:hypothetical protein